MKRHVTLIEMMIVMFLIALITGVVAYNYRGSLDAGKAFKTKTSIDRIETILNLAAAEGNTSVDDVIANWQQHLRNSSMVKNPDDFLKDGWGVEFQPGIDNGVIKVKSQQLDAYEGKGGNTRH